MTAEMTTKDLVTRIASCIYLGGDECSCEQVVERYRMEQCRKVLLAVIDDFNSKEIRECYMGLVIDKIANDPERLAKLMEASGG